MIKFELNGRPFNPKDFSDMILKAAMDAVAEHVRERVGSIRHPETGEFPSIVITGTGLDDLSFRVEGSPELLAIVNERMGLEGISDGSDTSENEVTVPRAFLSYAFEDSDLAEKIANALQANGIDTWWAGWCMQAGDSLRQKIDEGLGDCTHFIVLLTPTSLTKPWVNQEMDAGLVGKIRDRCKFIPLRYGLATEALPPLLSGMLSPEITAPDVDVQQLVNDIHGISKKPPLGAPPAAVVLSQGKKTGYSQAANAVAKVFVDMSTNAMPFDPQLSILDLQNRTGLSADDVNDALHELQTMITVSHGWARPEGMLFATFDKFWRDWDPAADALKLAADMINDNTFPNSPAEIASRYDWPARRLNSAMTYLINRDLVRALNTIASAPWVTILLEKTDATRRFVKSRS